MPNKHPFDDQLRQALRGFEPEVNAPWDAFERELDGVKSVPEPSPANTVSTVGLWLRPWRQGVR